MDFEANKNDDVNFDEAPLSPVLCDNKTNRKMLMSKRTQRKSRVKLMNRFAPEESIVNDNNIQENKLCPVIDDESFTPSQVQNVLDSIEIFEKIESEQSQIKEVKSQICDKKIEDFNFKKPIVPSPNKVLKTIHAESEGFQTASGRNILVSNQEIQRSKTLFEDILNPSELLTDGNRCNKYSFLSKVNNKSENSVCTGAHAKANDNIKDIDKQTITTCQSKNKVQFGSFKTASNKGIVLTESALKSAKCMFNEEFMEDSTPSFDLNKTIHANKNSISGFKKASGSEIKITNSALKIAKSVFGEELMGNSPDVNEETDALNSQETDAVFSNFTMIEDTILKDSSLHYLNSSFEKTSNVSEDFFKGFSESSAEESNKKADTFSMFVTKFSKKIKTKFHGSKRQLHDFHGAPELKRFKQTDIKLKSTSFQGFSSASGNAIKISRSSLDKAQQIFKEINIINENKTNSESSNNSFSNVSSNSLNIAKKISVENTTPSVGFQTASGSSCKLSEEALRKAQELFKNVTSDIEDTAKPIGSRNTSQGNMFFDQNLEDPNKKTNTTSLNDSGKSLRKKRLGTSICKPMHISKDKLERAKLLFEDEQPVALSPIRVTKPTSVYNSTPLKNDQGDISIDSNITPIKKTNIINTSRDSCIVEDNIIIQACTEGNIDSWIENLESERKKLEMNLKMIMERQEALTLQKSLLKSSCPNRRKKRIGVLLKKKETSSRIALKNICKTESPLVKFTSITPQNAEMVHFDCGGKYTSSIITEDGATIIPNVKNLIGLSEIEMAFKIMPGVESNLIPNGWIRNHFKWIVWKLASYERFTTHLKDCLTIENVVQQLKYRYDREIDKAERPTLRKIFEKDDVPQKRMVLCVSQIFSFKNRDIELELTDGWYSVRTVIDEPLRWQIYKQKIQIGTKLITCGAELLNCDGCHPLEATDMVRLKITCNSTRRAAWYARLGYQRCVEPFPLMLRSLFPNGGTVGCIKVYVARVYPVKYLEKQNNLTVWRNKKAEEIRAQDWENERLKKLEEVREVVRKDYERSVQNLEQNDNINVTKSDIKNIRCPRTLYNLYQNSKDPESLQESLSQSQKNAIIEYQQQLSFRQQEEMRVKMQESINNLQMSQRNVTPVLQLLLIDVLDSEEKMCTFQIWKPSEAHLQLIRESSVFYIYNVFPKKNGDLTSSKHTKFEIVKEEFPQFQRYKRILFPIADLTSPTVNKQLFKEFDTVGIIVQITINSFSQSLWLADCSEKLLIIRVFEGPKNCLLLENFKCGQLVAVSNLKHCESNNDFGEAIANHSTIISCYPQYRHLQEGINAFNNQLPKDMKAFLEKCTQKITYLIDKVSLTKNSKNDSLTSFIQSRSLNTGDSLDDSSEESTLVYSRLTSTDVALSMIDIDKLT